MLNKVKQFLKRHKDFFLVKCLIAVKRKVKEKQSITRLKKLKNVHVAHDRKVRVLFIVVNKNTWTKIKPLYLEMLSCNKIDAKMICCPEPFKDDTGTTYCYFSEQGYQCIDARVGEEPWNAMQGKGQWFDIKKLKPDYVFYTEPYNWYLPSKYRSNVVSGYAKICVVEYGMNITEKFLSIRPYDFYRDVYLCYANNIDEKEYNIKQFFRQHQMGLQKTKYLGFLAAADIVKQKKMESKSWDFSKNKIRAIWTPRWTLDESIGGTNFFRYKDVLFSYAGQHNDVDFLFRPHPMALDNFLRTGKMTKMEVDEFVETCEKSANISLDRQADYITSFWNSSFLVTDISSIIVEYFITGKPIVYCKTLHDEQVYLPFFKKILNICYIVDNENELLKVLNYLRNGNDEKKADREKLITEIFKNDPIKTPKNILNDLLKDAYRNSD